MSNPITDTKTIIAALHILAKEIQSGDGVANAAIREAAGRLGELSSENERLTNLLEELTDERNRNDNREST